MESIGIYIHIPFCQSKCFYCDFNSYTDKIEWVNRYINSMKKEIDIYAKNLKEYSVETIFIGGGTPTIIHGSYIYDLLGHIHKKLDTSRLKEITIESNPKTLDTEKLSIYREAGINRVSVGVQTLNDKLLKRIGRIHNTEDFLYSYRLLREQGFDNINLDVMFNLPQQTKVTLKETLYRVIALKPEHLSFYSLKVEEGTLFHRQHLESKLELPDEDTEREMYDIGMTLLKQGRYKHYEISNFSIKDFQCIHNLKYWKVEPYIGLGLGAHSNMFNERYWNYKYFNDYFHCIDKAILPIEGRENIDRKMEMAEYIILGLRLIEGVSKIAFHNRFNRSIDELYGGKLKEFSQKGLLKNDKRKIRLTKKGINLSNLVFSELLPD